MNRFVPFERIDDGRVDTAVTRRKLRASRTAHAHIGTTPWPAIKMSCVVVLVENIIVMMTMNTGRCCRLSLRVAIKCLISWYVRRHVITLLTTVVRVGQTCYEIKRTAAAGARSFLWTGRLCVLSAPDPIVSSYAKRGGGTSRFTVALLFVLIIIILCYGLQNPLIFY
jgi:hypothetical protein